MATSSTSKLENLTKEDLVKYIKKQQSTLKQTRIKCEGLNSQLKEKQNEVDELEKDKETWLSKSVQAEFEKKDEISAKEQELQMAADLGQQMLDANDKLKEELEILQTDHSRVVHDLQNVTLERDALKSSLDSQEGKNLSETRGLPKSEISVEESNRLLKKIEELQVEREETLVTLDNLKKERNQLTITCKDLKKRMLLLENDVERMDKGNKSPAEEKIHILTKENMDLASKIEMLEEDRIDIIKEFETLQEVLSKFEEKDKEFEIAKQEKERANEELRRLTHELEISRQETAELKETLDNYNSDQAAIQSSYSNIKKEKSEMKRKNEELNRQIEELMTMKNNWESSLSVIIEERDRAVEDFKDIKTKYEEKKTEYAEINQRNKELSTQLQTVNQEYSQLRTTNDNINEKIRKDEEFRKDLLRETEKLKSEREKFTKSCRALKTSLEDSKKALEQMTLDCEEQKTTIENLQRDKKKIAQLLKKSKENLKAAEKQKTHESPLKSELEALVSERDALSSTLKEVQVENERLEELHKTLEKQHECVIFEKDEAQLSVKILQEEHDQIIQEKHKLEEDLKNRDKNKAELENEMKCVNDTLGEEREKMEDIFGNMKGELMSSMQDNEVLKKQLSQISGAKEELELRHGKTSEELNIVLQDKKDLEKQLSFTTGEKNKVQHALNAIQKQWEEHQGTCEGSQEDLHKTIQRLVAEKTEIEKLLGDRTSELSTMEDERQELVKKIKETEKEKEEVGQNLQEQLSSLESEYEVVDSKAKLAETKTRKEYKNDMENSTQQLSAEVLKLHDEKNHLDGEIEELFHAHDELQVKYDNEIQANKELNDLVIKVSGEKEYFFKENKILSERLSEIQSNQLGAESDYYTQILGLQEMNESLLRDVDGLRTKLNINEKQDLKSEIKDTGAPKDDVSDDQVFVVEFNEKVEQSGDTQAQQIEILEKTIAGLNGAKDKAHSKLEEIEEDYENRFAVLSDELQTQKKKYEELNESVSQLNNTIEFLQRQLSDNEKEMLALKGAKETSDSDIVRLNEEIQVMQENSAGLNKLKQHLESENNEVKENLKLWEEKYTAQHREKEKQDEEILKLIAFFSESISVVEDDNNDEETLSLVNKVKNCLTKHRKENTILLSKVQKQENEISNLQENSKSLLEQLELKQRELCEKEQVYSKDEHDVDNTKTVLDHLTEKLEEKSCECEQLTSQLKNERNALNDLEKKCKSLEELSNEKDRCLDEVKLAEKERVVNLEEAVGKIRAEGEEKDKLLVNLEQTLSDQNQETERLQNEMIYLQNTFQEEKETLVNQIQELSEKDSWKVNEEIKLREEINQYTKEIDYLKVTIQAKETEINELRQVLESQKFKYCELEEVMNVKTEELGNCKGELANLYEETSLKEKQLSQLKGDLEKESKAINEREMVIKEEVIKKEEELKSFAANENDLLDQVRSSTEILKEKEKCLEDLKQDIIRHASENTALQEEINRLREYVKNTDDNARVDQETIQKHERDVEGNKALMGDLEKMNKELTNKVAKLKQVAVKAKRETETVKKKFEEERIAYTETIQEKDDLLSSKVDYNEVNEKHLVKIKELQERTNALEEETCVLKEQLVTIQKQLEESQSETEVLKEKLDNYEKEKDDFDEKYATVCKENEVHRQNIDEYQESMSSLKEKHLILEEENRQKCGELAQISEKHTSIEQELEMERQKVEDSNTELENMKEKLELAEKEGGKWSLVDLELKDCQKAMESLQNNLTENLEDLERKKAEIEELQNCVEEKENEIVLLKEKVSQSEQKGNKLKNMLVKTRKELELTKKQESIAQDEINEVQQHLELKTRELENIKVELSVLHAGKQTLEQQLLSVIESNKVNIDSLNGKLHRVKSECDTAKRSEEAIKIEYENYKIRVHSVLKQQKAKPSSMVTEVEADERSILQQNLIQLKIKLQEKSEKLTTLQSDYEDLEVENDRLTTQHKQVVQDSEKKEMFWKDKIEQITLDYTTNLEHHKESIQHLTIKNETFSNTYKEKIRKLEDENKQLKERLRNEITELEKERQKQTTKEKQRSRESPPLRLNLTHESPGLKTEEREAGEGMDITELEKADVSSPLSAPSSANLASPVALEKLLSPSQTSGISDFPKMDNSRIPTDDFVSQSELTKAQREIEHLAELLRESEATSMRLGEQAKVLKDEIRRLERNQERDQGLSNLEYLKNIILKFLSKEPNEKEQLIPVLTAMLKLSDEEKEFMINFARETEGKSEENNATWSSYLYRWSSVN